MSKSLDLDTESKVIDSVNGKKKAAIKPVGFGKQSVAGSIRITDSVASDKTEAKDEEVVTEEVKTEVKDEAEKPSASPFTADDLKTILTNAVAAAVEPLNARLDSVTEENKALAAKLAEADSKVEETKTQLDEAAVKASILEDLGKLFGKSVDAVPMVNRTVTSKSDKPEGILKEYFQEVDRAPKMRKITDQGDIVVAKDNAVLKQLVRENKAQLIKDLESYGKANGLLQGTRVTDAATIGSDIPGGFLDVLSSIMRTNNRPGFIFHQFVDTSYDFAKSAGDNIRVPRAAFLPTAQTSDDRLLSGAGVYYNIDSGNQNLATGTVSVMLREYGLGKNSQYPPVAIPQFVSAYSMIDLMSILERNLQYDYFWFEDRAIRELWIPTSRTVYNKNGVIATSAASLAANDVGTMTYKFLVALYAYMRQLQIPTYADGSYGLALHSVASGQLKQDLSSAFFRVQSSAELEELTSIMNPTLQGEVDKIQGFVGKIAGFLIFESNATSLGAAGTEGTRNETIASSSRQTRTSYAFGANTAARGIGTPFELRTDTNDNFGRIKRMSWISHEGYAPLDIDPTGYNDSSAVPQQLRVLDVRTVDTAF